MNNQQEMSVGEQFVRLQNIAYIKQFLRKGSIKLLMVASLLCTFVTGFFAFSFVGIIKNIIDALNLGTGMTLTRLLILLQQQVLSLPEFQLLLVLFFLLHCFSLL